MQEQLLNAQQELAEMQIEGSAGGDLVTATLPAQASSWDW
jgi:DNA-binding protein YbaB